MEILKDLVYLFLNHILNWIPSRTIRRIIYWLVSGGRISHKATIGLGVKILDIRNVSIGPNSNVNWGSVLDGRGAEVRIGRGVDIAPQVNIWTMEHIPGDDAHRTESSAVIVEDFCWLANRVTILPGITIGTGSTLAAGSVVTKDQPPFSLIAGVPARVIRKNISKRTRPPRPLRRFR